MKKMFSVERFSLIAFISGLTVLFLCCKETVIIGSSLERYDHNRSKTIVIKSKSGDTLFYGLVSDNGYSPRGSKSFPYAAFKYGDSLVKDSIPSAIVVPIFNGILLPLSDTSIGKEQSDKKDLIDFLSTGPFAQAGVTIPEMTADSKSTGAVYKDALDFLSSIKNLEGDRTSVIIKLKSIKLTVADEVRESRFRERAFANILAFKKDAFWFVLYKLPKMEYYSRLVVVPAITKRPSRTEEKP